MLKKIYTTLLVVISAGTLAFAQSGILKGKVSDKVSGEAISFANVQLEQNGTAVAKTVADVDGNYTIKPIPPGTYDLRVAFLGYQPMVVQQVAIRADNTTYQDLKISSAAKELGPVDIVVYEKPIIDPNGTPITTMTRKEFEALPQQTIDAAAALAAGVTQSDDGGALSIRGGRQNTSGPDGGSTKYYIDGVPAVGTTGLPKGDIEQISVITGGVPAQYGDATGGVINISTRGGLHPDYYGNVELTSSQLTDAFGKNYIGASVGGPLVSKKDSSGHKTPKVGFFISGEANTDKDPSPSASGVYKVNDAKLQQLQQHPLQLNPDGSGTILSADYLTMNDMQLVKARQNVRSNTASLGGKLDFQMTDNIMLTLGGSMDYGNYHDFVQAYSLFNPSNNPQVIYNNIRMYGKITQHLGRVHSKDEKATSLFQNAYYTLQVSYSTYSQTVQSEDHTNNFFDYGYVGKFQTYRTPVYAAVRDSATGPVKYYDQTTWQDSAVKFTPGTLNPLAANYTSDYYSLGGAPQTLSDIQPLGMLNGDRPQSPYSLWYNTGREYGGYNQTQENQLRVSGMFSTDIKNHAIQAGFEYEKRTERYWSVSATSLWTLGRQLVNQHLTQLDTAHTTITTVDGVDYHTHPYYDNVSSESQFGKSLRSSLGKNETDWVDIDMLDPSQMSVGMFSPDELLNSGSSLVSYYGYSYDDKKLTGTSFNMAALESFYKDKDASGNYTRIIPAYQPIYAAGYIQDKFDIKDMKFLVGLRVDAYNNNQPMLKDKYLLNEAYTVSNAPSTIFKNTPAPSNMGSNYVLYVDNAQNPTKVVGYRNGDNWYDATGVKVTDPTVIAHATTSGSIQPFLKYPNENFLDSSKVDNVFQMYSTQINLMPRISFSFPISDRAMFFAHYDELTQRPPANTLFDPTNYLFIQSLYSIPINNPALKPERTTDYEVGFSQVLNEQKSAALTLSAYYRQMRDMLQEISVFDAYPVSYITYGNVDFGNVKGFTAKYDLRRTQNSQLTASYTLQFATGTGSASSSASSVIASGQPNLRTTSPLDFDQRHAIVVSYDYRFGAGKDYRGPQASWAKAIFENLGGNLIFRMGSGLPYSRLLNVVSGNGNNGTQVIMGLNQPSTLQGDINGSNMPWQYRVDLRIDKNFYLKWGKGGEDRVKHSYLDVYVQVLNLLNTQNILAVYRHTGDPKDDGYLSYPGNQSLINSYASSEAFIDMYNAKLLNPGNYSIPRRIRIGAVLNF